MSDSKPPQDPETTSPSSEADAEAARLLEAGLSGGLSGSPRSEPPSPESMAAHFPALEILEVIGQGGMGVVYKARQRKLDRLVALKVLPRELSSDPAFAERFTREARTLARLTHPHIVGVFEFGESDGLYYLLMEYVDGVTLRELMSSGELTPREALAIVPQMCEALQFAHDQGVVHRDIKPENVLLDRAGRVKVADFGLAKLMQRGPGDFTLTGTDQVMGTLHYMAPEQYKTPQDVDHRADIFSLGVVFYEMLTNELPVGRFSKPSDAGNLDVRIDEIVMRTLERSRDLRYQKASDVETDVETFVGQSAGSLSPAGPSPEDGPASHRERRPAGHGWHRDDGRPFSRLALWSILLVPILGGLSLILYALVLNLYEPRDRAAFEGSMAGLIAASVAAFLITLVAAGGVVHTRIARKRVRGLGLAIAALVIGMACSTTFLSVMAQERRSHRRQVQWEAELERRRRLSPEANSPGYRPPIDAPPIFVGITDYRRRTQIHEGIHKTWASYVDRVAWKEVGLSELEGLYHQVDRNRLAALSATEFQAQRNAMRLGMGLITEEDAGVPLYQFRLSRIEVDRWERNATVTASHRVFRDEAWHTTSIAFRMTRAGGGWVFALGLVTITK